LTGYRSLLRVLFFKFSSFLQILELRNENCYTHFFSYDCVCACRIAKIRYIGGQLANSGLRNILMQFPNYVHQCSIMNVYVLRNIT
jgi:hypothetical protein